jgi:hypothetical protein
MPSPMPPKVGAYPDIFSEPEAKYHATVPLKKSSLNLVANIPVNTNAYHCKKTPWTNIVVVNNLVQPGWNPAKKRLLTQKKSSTKT